MSSEDESVDAAQPKAERSFYKNHVFFCTNVREPGERRSCGRHGAVEARDHAKKRIKELKLGKPGSVRINNAGCMERCELGPCLVIYPQGTWYGYKDQADVDEIIDRHVVGGEIVDRLKLR
jgi:(2Fe-2S) ferredoxin